MKTAEVSYIITLFMSEFYRNFHAELEVCRVIHHFITFVLLINTACNSGSSVRGVALPWLADWSDFYIKAWRKALLKGKP